MNKKFILTSIITIFVFCGLVGYNYLVAQKNIQQTRPSPLSLSLVSYPEEVTIGQNGTFIWSINSSPDLSTSKTTIYYGFDASPSALTTADSPEAVDYAFHLEDYFHGTFSLPDTFDQSIKFEKLGKIYFRAYAKVGDKHLWTEEKSLLVVPQK